jgi:hypothetical protein
MNLLRHTLYEGVLDVNQQPVCNLHSQTLGLFDHSEVKQVPDGMTQSGELQRR